MAVRPIVITGEPVLHRPAALVEAFDDGLRQLVADMFDTMDAAHGVGLAAPQIAVPLRLFVYEMANDDDVPGAGRHHQPDALAQQDLDGPPRSRHRERGLPVGPGESYPLKRADQVSVVGFDADGEALSFRATGWFARVMQHEFDHLNGLLYVDRLDDKQTRRARKAIRANGWGKAGNTWMPGVDRDPFGHDDDHEDGDAFLDATGHDDRLV